MRNSYVIDNLQFMMNSEDKWLSKMIFNNIEDYRKITGVFTGWLFVMLFHMWLEIIL